MNYKKIELKKINIKHIKKKYLSWMNYWEIIRYTEQKYRKITYSNIKKYIINTNKSSISVMIKNGFKKEAVFRSQVVFEGKKFSSYIYGHVVK